MSSDGAPGRPLDAALGYLARGWSVIPLRSTGTTEDRKRPAVEWKAYQAAAPTEDEVRQWWRDNPWAGVAVVTGSVSRLVVLDLDGPRAKALLNARGLTLPRTATVRTGKGYHVYYRYAGGDIGCRTRLLSDASGSAVDVRGEGGYVVAPPTQHGSGKRYTWVVPPEELAAVPPELEEWLLSATVPDPSTPESPDWWGAVAGGVSEGARNEAAARVAGYFARATHGDPEATSRAVSLWNARNTPPLPESELAGVVHSILRREVVRQRAEVAKAAPRLELVSGERLAAELEHADPRHGTTVPVPGIDLIGGLVPGELVVVAGRPGAGKTSLATMLTAQACLAKYIPTLVVTTELSRRQWGFWTAAASWRCPVEHLDRPLPRALLGLFRAAPLTVCDAGAPSIADIRAAAEATLGVRLLIVDHVGRVSGGRRETRTLEVGDVARGLKALARDLDCTVVALCQLNRDIENREDKRPRLSDLRDSGEVEQEADAVLFLYPPRPFDKTAPSRELVLALEKFRHGGLADLRVRFLPASHRFERVGAE